MVSHPLQLQLASQSQCVPTCVYMYMHFVGLYYIDEICALCEKMLDYRFSAKTFDAIMLMFVP